MADEKLLATYHKTRKELADERSIRMGELEAANRDLADARANLEVAQERERIAIQADEEAAEKMRVMRDDLNGRLEKSEYLLAKLSRLQQDQLETSRERNAHHEVVRERQRELERVSARHAAAVQELAEIDRDIADLDEKIRDVENAG